MLNNFGQRNINLPGPTNMMSRGTPGINNAGMGQLPFGNQLPGNQGQGIGPSAGLLQQLFPLIQQMQSGQGQPGMIGSAMSSMNAANKPMQAPVQAQPPNQNMLVGNSMQSAPTDNSGGGMSPRSRMFNPGSVRY